MLSIKNKGLMLNAVKFCKRIECKMENVDENEYGLNVDIKNVICFNLKKYWLEDNINEK